MAEIDDSNAGEDTADGPVSIDEAVNEPDTVMGEVVDGEPGLDEFVVSPDWQAQLGADLDQSEAGKDWQELIEREVDAATDEKPVDGGGDGALPLDVDLAPFEADELTDDGSMEQEGEGESFDFGGDLGDEEGVNPDDLEVDELDEDDFDDASVYEDVAPVADAAEFDELPEIGAFEVDEGSALPVDLDLDASPSKSATVVQEESLAESLNRVVSGDDLWARDLEGSWGAEVVRPQNDSGRTRVTDLLDSLPPEPMQYQEIERTTALDMSSIETGSAEPIEAEVHADLAVVQEQPVDTYENYREPPTDGEFEEAAALLARLTAQRRATIEGTDEAQLSLRVEHDLFSDDGQRVSRIEYSELEAIEVEDVSDQDVSDYVSIDLDVDDEDIAYVIDEQDVEDAPDGLLAFPAKSLVEALSEGAFPPPDVSSKVSASPHWLEEVVLPDWVRMDDDQSMPVADAMGVPFLGAIPELQPVNEPLHFPEGSVALAPVFASRRPVALQEFTLPDGVTSGETWAHRLLFFLDGERITAQEPRRRALVLHAMAILLQEFIGDTPSAIQALKGARGCDPDFRLNSDYLRGLLTLEGRTDDLLEDALQFGEQQGLHRAGHIYDGHLNNAMRALEVWSRPNWDSAVCGLARYLTALRTYDWDAAFAAIQEFDAGAESAPLRSALSLERARLAHEVSDGVSIPPLYEHALDGHGSVAGSVGLAEIYGIEVGEVGLAVTALRRRYTEALAEGRDGGDRDTLKRQFEEILFKTARLLEQSGRYREALQEYDRLLQIEGRSVSALRRASALARRAGQIDRLLDYLVVQARQTELPQEAAQWFYEAGLLANQTGDDRRAADFFAQSLKALPSFTPALARLSRYAKARGKHDEVCDRYLAEIEHLEGVVKAGGTSGLAKAKNGLLRRYLRLGYLLREQAPTGENAAVLFKRALGVDPDCLPALVALQAQYRRSNAWSDLAALNLGWLQRTSLSGHSTVDVLLETADVLRVYLSDLEGAARLYARVITLQPDHHYALERARQVFLGLGRCAHLVEIESRMSESGAAHERAMHLIQAGQLQELDGEPQSAAVEAIPFFEKALETSYGERAALDALIRIYGRLNAAQQLRRDIIWSHLSTVDEPVLFFGAVEVLLAQGHAGLAFDLLQTWAASGTYGQASSLTRYNYQLCMYSSSVALARWADAIHALAELAELSTGKARARFRFRQGYLYEMRLRDHEEALNAYYIALTAWPEYVAAQNGVTRLATDGHPQPVLALSNETDEHERTPFTEAHDIARALDEDEPVHLLAAFKRHPQSQAVFDALRLHLRRRGDFDVLSDVCRRRLPWAQPDEQAELLRALIGLSLKRGDADSAKDAAQALLKIEPDSLPARLALRRLEVTGGVAAGELESLRHTLQSPTGQAEIRLAEAQDARAAGQTALVRQLYENALDADPSNLKAGLAYEALLEDEQDYQTLATHLDRLLVSLPTGSRRVNALVRLAEILTGPLDRPSDALRILTPEVEVIGDARLYLLAADACEKLGDMSGADEFYEQAAALDTRALSPAVMLARAKSLAARSAFAEARALLTVYLDENPTDMAALELSTEVFAALSDWREVIMAVRRLMELETDSTAKAKRAMGIGRIFADAYGDSRRAAGWYRRAVLHNPLDMGAIGAFCETVGGLDAGTVPVAQINQTLEHALAAQHACLAEGPLGVTALTTMLELFEALGEREGVLQTLRVLDWTGRASAAQQAELDRLEKVRASHWKVHLTRDLRERFVVDGREHGEGAALYDAVAPLLLDVMAAPMQMGIPRLSKRSFRNWQDDFHALRIQLDAPEVELWNGGRTVPQVEGAFLPQTALIVPIDLLERAMTPSDRMALGYALDGLKKMRSMLLKPGLAEVFAYLEAIIEPGFAAKAGQGALVNPASLRRVRDRARQLPRRHLTVVRQYEGSFADAKRAIELLESGTRRTGARVGFLGADDIRVALDYQIFDSRQHAVAARRAGGTLAALEASSDGRDLVRYALSEQYLRLRRILHGEETA